MTVYLLALGAALLFGIGSVVQQRVAFVAPPGKSLRPSLLLWLVRQPLWLAGVGTALVGNVLSGTALGMGSVALVQPLLVARLVFALPLSAVWMRQRLTRRDWLGMLATACGLGTFIAVGAPEASTGGDTPWWQWLLVAGVIGILTGALVVLARRLAPAREAPILGAGAGMLFALQAGLTQTAVGSFLNDGFLALLLNWATYAVVLTAVLGTLLAQSAYGMAPLAASYPALAAVEPLAGIGIGVGILGTVLTVGVLPVSVYAAALAVMTAGIYLLATSPLVTGQQKAVDVRRTEERIAETERRLGDDLQHLETLVARLRQEREVGKPASAKAGRDLRESDDWLAGIGTRFEHLADLNVECETPATTDGESRENKPMQALAQYHRDNRRRERQLRARAERVRSAAEEERRAVRPR